VRLANETIDAGTIVLAPSIAPSVIASAIPVVYDQRSRIAVDETMRSRSHPQVWALGDCAAIPGPDGRPYPALAQHTIREARPAASRDIGYSRHKPNRLAASASVTMGTLSQRSSFNRCGSPETTTLGLPIQGGRWGAL
jgi:NADH dehydrogenase FAD-containing subunit